MINLEIHTQPDDESCGPTSLHAIYQYYGFKTNLNELVKAMPRSLSGGTLAANLGEHALKNNFSAELFVSNVNIFDPTWFSENGAADNLFLIDKLNQQLKYKKSYKMLRASQAYLDFLKLDGKIYFKTIHAQLLKHYFNQNIPVLAGLSATYLYRSAREIFLDNGVSVYDDLRGTPCGHFVVLCGYDDTHRLVVVADPHKQNPLSNDNYYRVGINRLLNAIMLGVITDDANLLIIKR